MAKSEAEWKMLSDIKKDTKAFYTYVKGNTKIKDTVGPLMEKAGTIVTDDRRAASLLNDQFVSVFTEEDTTYVPEPVQIFKEHVSNKLTDMVVTPAQVEKLLSKLNRKKAPGVDGILPGVLRELASCLADPLSILFRKSLDSGYVPIDWRMANVTPIYKKGPRHMPENYRPVSLTSHISKLMETIIREGILQHLKQYKLIRESQHGFTKKRSCLTNLLVFLENVTKAIDEGHPLDILYLDFSKAFDKVPHKRLIRKLEAHGIGDKVKTWIESWLENRMQKVVVRGNSSSWSPVSSGVPQGSVLGPTLFIIYINDIEEGLCGNVLKFADDTKVFRKVATSEEAFSMQEDLQKLCKWSVDWQMLFNADKCACMHVGAKNQHYDYFIGDELIKTTTAEKDLGVIIHQSLKVEHQVAAAVKKANRCLGIIKRNFACQEMSFIVKLYKATWTTVVRHGGHIYKRTSISWKMFRREH
jgi:hypothetical protein